VIRYRHPPQGASMFVQHINGLIKFEVADDSVIVREILVREAHKRTAQYPQYHGYFAGDEWFVVRAKRDVKSRGGLLLQRGDLAIARKHPQDEVDAGIANPEFVTLHSPITGHQHSVHAKRDVEAVR
jgi:hypothetical protein